MTIPTVLFDANVLYPSLIRDILIRLAGSGDFHARWTDQILDEVFRNLKKNRPDIDPKRLNRTRTLMCKAVTNCLVTDYQHRIDDLHLPDPDDRHVLAAAIECGAQVIVTENKRDFPHDELAKYGIQAQTLDEFLCDQIDQFTDQATTEQLIQLEKILPDVFSEALIKQIIHSDKNLTPDEQPPHDDASNLTLFENLLSEQLSQSLHEQMTLLDSSVYQAIIEAQQAWKNPPRTVEQILDILAETAPQTVQRLRS